MADGSHIQWTDATWNPITGCAIKSPGCANCYAMELAATRLRNHPSREGLTREVNGHHVWIGNVRFNAQWLLQPLEWSRPRDIFVVAHGDLFYERVPPLWRANVVGVMRQAHWHRYQILTKRPDIMLDALCDEAPMPHVWLGASVERQPEADERRGPLAELAERGWNTWVSYEPALGPVDWSGWEFIRSLVSGGESGRRARPSHPDWHRVARDWCAPQGISYHFKQWGEWAPIGEWGAGLSASNSRHETAIMLSGERVPDDVNPDDCHGQRMARIGKAAAGRLLDGATHDDRPGHQA